MTQIWTQPRYEGGSADGIGRGSRQRRLGEATGLSVLAVLVGLLAAGCGDKGDNLDRLSPRSTPYLSGVAVPAAFSLVEKNTEDYESGAQRWARHLYRGNASLPAVRNFYREQMPLQGWNRVTDQNVKGTVYLRFEKATEACTVQITPTGFFNWCTIQIVVMPFSRNPTEPPPRRPMP